jgi:hypothetical protein
VLVVRGRGPVGCVAHAAQCEAKRQQRPA